jgi:hypothetical protein
LNVDTPAVVIFGKPNNVEKRFDEIFLELDNNIIDGTEGFIKYLSEPSKNLAPQLIRTIKTNYSNFIFRKKSLFQSGVSTIIQSLVNEEQKYIQTLGRVNVITYAGTPNNGTDGLQSKSGPVTVYVTIGTPDVHKSSSAPDTLLELVDDTKKIQEDIQAFNDAIQAPFKFIYAGTGVEYEGNLVFQVADGKSKAVTTTEVFLPFSTNPLFSKNVENYPNRRVYMALSDDILDDKKYETFKQEMIGNVLTNKTLLGNGSIDIQKLFDDYWLLKLRPVFLEENNITKSFIDNLEKTSLKNFLIYTPFDKKTRDFTFTTENGASESKKSSQENMIKGLANSSNQNTNINTWNDLNGNDTGAFISKAKLN